MFTLLYKLYFIEFKNPNIDSYFVRIIIRIFNYILPFYFKLTTSLSSNKLNKKGIGNNETYIVSLTTFPKRIDKVWLTIESILRQKIKPDRLIIWLYEGEFNGLSSLPKELLNQKKRGLEIRFVNENLMPHKKYFYAMQEFPEANIITIDDDFIYPLNMLSKLIKFHKKYPREICCMLTRDIKVEGEIILPYKKWDYMKINTLPRYNNLTMGGGGTLFPKKSLHDDAFNIIELKKNALRADDLWLKIMSLKNKTKVVGLGGEYSRLFVPIIKRDNIRLMDTNIGEGGNDKIFKYLIKYYKIPLSIFKS